MPTMSARDSRVLFRHDYDFRDVHVRRHRGQADGRRFQCLRDRHVECEWRMHVLGSLGETSMLQAFPTRWRNSVHLLRGHLGFDA